MHPLGFILSFGALAAFTGCTAKPDSISPADAARLFSEGKAVLVDVREPHEWADTGVAAPAVLLAMSDFNGERKDWKPFLAQNAGKELILYCRSGRRSGLVAEKLAGEGWVVRNAGGFQDWEKAGLPTRAP